MRGCGSERIERCRAIHFDLRVESALPQSDNPAPRTQPSPPPLSVRERELYQMNVSPDEKPLRARGPRGRGRPEATFRGIVSLLSP